MREEGKEEEKRKDSRFESVIRPLSDVWEEFLLHISESFADASTRELGNNHVMHPLQHVNELNILLYESIN